MIVYEVTLHAQRGIEAAFRTWLDAHVAHMLALPGFSGARVLERLAPAAADEVSLCVQYELEDRKALDDYLAEHAARMRAEGIAHFGDRFHAERRVLALLPDY